MNALARRLFDPSDPTTLLLAPLVAYFVWWGCAATSAPTLRPASALPEGHTTQVGATANASASLLNAGVGGTVFGQYRLLDDHLELAGYLETGGVVSPLWLALTSATPAAEPQPVGGVLGGGGAVRYLFDLGDRFRVGAEVHLGAAHVVATVYDSSGAAAIDPTVPGGRLNIGLYQAYVGVPASVRVTDNFSLFTNPAFGGQLLVLWEVLGTAVLPSGRLPLGAQLRLSDHVAMLIEVGAAGGFPLGVSPYGSLGVTASF